MMMSINVSAGPTSLIRAPGGVEWEASPATQRSWQGVLATSSEPHLTQTPEWVNVVGEALGARNATRMYRSSDGRQIVLPLVATGPPRLATYRSLPHGCGRGGLIADGPIDRDAVDVVLQDLVRLGGFAARIRVQPEQDDVWTGCQAHGFTAVHRVTHITDISAGCEHVWKSVISGRTRTRIRKATKVGVRVESAAGDALVPVFYELYEAWTRERAARRRLPAALLQTIARRREPRRKFDVAARRLPDNLRIWAAYLDDRPISAAIQLIYGVHSTYWRGYGLREITGRTGATYLLQWRMIEEASRLGCATHDMGESGGVESLMQFKELLGATPRPYSELYREVLPVTGAIKAVRGTVLGKLGRRRQLNAPEQD